MLKREFYVLIERDEDGVFIGEVPQLCGCYTQGRTLDDLMSNTRGVIQLCFEEQPEIESCLNFSESERRLSDVEIASTPGKRGYPDTGTSGLSRCLSAKQSPSLHDLSLTDGSSSESFNIFTASLAASTDRRADSNASLAESFVKRSQGSV